MIARDDSWADAATGGAYAALSGDPIVVTPSGSLHGAVEAFLAGRSLNDIVLLGGTAALSASVEQAAAGHGPVRRVAGDARDATATAIATQLWPRTDQVTVVNGYADDGWVHALAAASPAAALAAPQVHVQAQTIPPATQTYLDEYGPMDMVIGAGPAGHVSDGVIMAAGGGQGPVHDGGGGDTYDPHAAEGGQYTFDAGTDHITFVSGNYASWVTRGEYHPGGGPDFPGNGPTILLYFDDDSGEERRIVCGYAED